MGFNECDHPGCEKQITHYGVQVRPSDKHELCVVLAMCKEHGEPMGMLTHDEVVDGLKKGHYGKVMFYDFDCEYEDVCSEMEDKS